MNKAYRHIYKEGIGWVAVSESASCRSKMGARGCEIVEKSGLKDAMTRLKHLSIVLIGALSIGVVFVPTHVKAYSTGSPAATAGTSDDGKSTNTAVGEFAVIVASEGQSVVVGSRTTAQGPQNVAIGNDTISHGKGNIAIGSDDSNGYGADANGYATAGRGIRRTAGANPGYRLSVAVGNAATSLGAHSQSLADGALALGAAATAGKAASWITEAAGSSVDAGLKFKSYTTQSGKNSTAIGAMSYAMSDDSTAVGKNAQALGTSSIAIGADSVANNTSSITIGKNSSVTVDDGVAIGSNSLADRVATTPQKGVFSGEALNETNTYSAVSVGTTAKRRQIINVADGVSDTDALNVRQAKKLQENLVSILGTSKVVADQATAGLYMVNNTIGATGKNTIIEALETKIKFSSDYGYVSKGLGETLEIKGGATSDDYSAGNVRTVAKSTGIEIQLANSPVFTGSVSANSFKTGGLTISSGGIDMGNKEITNLAAGTLDSSATTLKQMNEAIATVKDSLTASDQTATVKSSDNSIKITSATTGATTEYDLVLNGDKIKDLAGTAGVGDIKTQLEKIATNFGGGSVLDGSGSITAPNYLIAGEVKTNVGDALSALDEENQRLGRGEAGTVVYTDDEGNRVSNKLTNGRYYKIVDINPDGSYVYGDYVQTPRLSLVKNGGDTTQKIKLGNLAEGDVSKTSTDAINGSQLFATNSALAKLSTTLSTTPQIHYFSVNSVGYTPPPNGVNYNNDGATGDKAMAIGLGAKAGASASIAFGYESETVKYVDPAFPTAKPLASSIAIGYSAKSSNLYSISMGDKASASNRSSIAIGYRTKSEGGSGVAIGAHSFVGAKSNLGIALGQDSLINVDKTGDVAYFSGESIMNSDQNEMRLGKHDGGGVLSLGHKAGEMMPYEIAPGVTLPYEFDKRMQITNLAGGVGDYDAVNVKQLRAVYDNFKAVTGGTPDVNGTGAITFKNIGGTGKSTIDGAIASLNKTLSDTQVHYFSVNSTEQAAGSNYNNKGATGTDAIAIGVSAKAASKNSIAMGTGSSVTVDEGVAIGSNSLADRAVTTQTGAFSKVVLDQSNTYSAVSVGTKDKGRQIINVADGVEATDAVNVRQLEAVATAANTANAGWKLTVENDTTNVKPTDTVTLKGDNNINIKNSNGTVEFKLNKNLEATSVTTGDTVMSSDGITIGKDPATAVSLSNTGLNNGGKQITNVAAGSNDNDAVNVKQLNEVKSSITNSNANVTNVTNVIGGATNNYLGSDGKLTDEGKKALASHNVAGKGTTEHDNLIDAIKAINSTGTKFFHVNETGAVPANVGNTNDSSAGAKGAIAIGMKAEVAKGATDSIAIGTGAKANGVNSISIGTHNVVGGANSGAIGDPNNVAADNSYALGNTNTITKDSDNSFAVGNKASITAKNSVALGAETAVHEKGGVALGAGSVVDRGAADPEKSFFANSVSEDDKNAIKATVKGEMAEVSLGNANLTRRITNLAAGSIDSDAVNVAQLRAVMSSTSGAQFLTVNPKKITSKSEAKGDDSVALGAGSVARGKNSVALGAGSNDGGRDNVVSVGTPNSPRQITNVAPATQGSDAVNLDQLNAGLKDVYDTVGRYYDDAIAGVASAMAVGNLPQSTIPGKGMMSVGGGYYKDKSAIALGLSKMSDNGKWVFKAAASVDSRENLGAAASVGFHF